MPGQEVHLLAPFRGAGEMEMHPGQHPGRPVFLQGVVTEAQLLRCPVGDFLGHVHESGRLQAEGRIRIITGNGQALPEPVSFPNHFIHKLPG